MMPDVTVTVPTVENVKQMKKIKHLQVGEESGKMVKRRIEKNWAHIRSGTDRHVTSRVPWR
jgi:hypothetical protein